MGARSISNPRRLLSGLLTCLAFAQLGCGTSRPPLATVSPSPDLTHGIAWRDWSDNAFAQARAQNKFVLLDLVAVWCHWCHVMDETTYRDPAVVRLINQRYVAVRVDQDARPDLSARYEDYGWPATIVFGADGKEIVKRRGYLSSKSMASMLQAIIDDPTPGPSVQTPEPPGAAAESRLPPVLREALEKRLLDTYDAKEGSWGSAQKFLNWDDVEYCLVRAGKEPFDKMARQTLAQQLHLLDPAWGGVYQYSTDGDWKHPHFEKIMQMQAENLRIYAMAYERFHNPADLRAAERIRQYLKDFLTAPDGGFYTSQDADLIPGRHAGEYFALDDSHRRKLGVPRVDRHQYARENGWAIAALCTLNQDPGALSAAIAAANWVMHERSLPGGGFRHGQSDPAGPYLGDTLAMGRAFLALYSATAEPAWLDRAARAADFIDAHFRLPVGIAASAVKADARFAPAPEVDENIAVARFANLLFRYTGTQSHRALADHAMRYVAAPQVAATRGAPVGGILLADRELGSEPLHVAVVGSASDPRSQALLSTSRGYFDSYKRIDAVNPASGRIPPNSDVQYPKLRQPAAFLCADGACSAPITDPARLAEAMDRRLR